MTKKYQFQSFNGQTIELYQNSDNIKSDRIQSDKIKIEAIGADIFHIYSERAADFPSYAVQNRPAPVKLTERIDGSQRCYYTDKIGVCIGEDGGLILLTAKDSRCAKAFAGQSKNRNGWHRIFLSFWSARGIRLWYSRSRPR